MMWTLIKKDWRVNRATVIGAAVLSVMPYVLTILNQWVDPPKNSHQEVTYNYPAAIATAAMAAIFFTIFICAAFGGGSFAGERRERTAEFLGVLPVSRKKIVLSKLIVAWACIVLLLVTHLVVIVGCILFAENMGISRNSYPEFLIASGSYLSYAITLFGIAWALSIFIDSPAIAASIAIGVGVGIYFGGTAWMLKLFELLTDQTTTRAFYTRQNERIAALAVGALSALASVVAVGLSSVRYVRRSAP